jgi:hypothetical protein
MMNDPANRPPHAPGPLPAHPASPRRQRADAAYMARRRRPVRAASGPGYLRLHWRGELPLAAAVIVSAALVWAAVQAVEFAARRVPITEYPHAAAALWILEVLLLLPGAVWWGTGVMRSAARHVGRGGSASVALLTGAVGLGAFFWAAAFWWQSARYVAPDVWAILTGDAPPASVRVEPAAATAGPGRLVVTGDLEFGTTRAVREALDANPAVRTVQLDSRGGRAAEGLALGRLLLARNLDTLVTGECSSACVTAFAGGARRSIGASAKLGLHSVGGRGVSAANLAAANLRSDTFITNRGVDVKVLEKGAAVAADSIWFPPPDVVLGSGLATEWARGR